MFNYVCWVAKVQNPPPSGGSAGPHFRSPPLLMETTTLGPFHQHKEKLKIIRCKCLIKTQMKAHYRRHQYHSLCGLIWNETWLHYRGVFSLYFHRWELCQHNSAVGERWKAQYLLPKSWLGPTKSILLSYHHSLMLSLTKELDSLQARTPFPGWKA